MSRALRGEDGCGRWRGRRAAVLVVLAGSWLMVPPAPAQQQQLDELPDHYTDLWDRGEYADALAGIEVLIESSTNYVPFRLQRHRSQLLFAVGRVDEAIVEMADIAKKYQEPAYSLELAEMYRYRGQKQLYRSTLREAAIQTRGKDWRYSRREANYVAMGRIAELLGENPRTILSTHFGVIFDSWPKMVRAYIAAGDLAFRHDGYDIAAKHYESALAMDGEEDNQDALAGLAECYWKSSDRRLAATMAQLLELNPNHPRARAIEIEKILDKGKGRDALKIIAEMLAINPTSLRFRSLEAAAHFLEDDLEAMEHVQQEVLAFNPYCSEVYRVPGRVASRHYRFAQGAAMQAEALVIDPEDHEARALYSMDLLRLADEELGRSELQQAFDEDPYNVTVFNLLELMDTLETFEVIEEGPFVVKMPKHEAPLIADDVMSLLHQAFTQFEEKYEVEIKTPVYIEMFDRHDDFMVRSVGLPGSVGHLGICFGQLVTLDSPSARPRGSWNWRSVLWHEFVHVITLQKTKNRTPRWLTEGISVHEEGLYSPAWKAKLDADYRLLIRDEGIPGIRDIDGFFTNPGSAGRLMFGYFVAGEFVDFYVAQHGQDAMNVVLEAIAEGADAEDALAAAADETERALDRAFREHQKIRYAAFDNLPDPVELAKAAAEETALVWPPKKELPGISAEETRSPFTDAIEKAEAAIKEESWGDAVRAFEEAHALFPEHTGGDAPLRRIAQLYRQLDRDKELGEVLERILYWSPAELEAALELCARYGMDEEWEKLAETASWALGIDPYELKLQKAYAEALVELGETDKALDSLKIIAHLDPGRATDYQLQRVGILQEVGQLGAAREEIVAVLEESPHYWKAQEQLLAIVEVMDGALPTLSVLVDEPAKIQ